MPAFPRRDSALRYRAGRWGSRHRVFPSGRGSAGRRVGLGVWPLNGDEIIFGEIKVREPERRMRPDRDRRFACLAYEVPGPADLPIFLDRRAADAIERHALADTSVELGGILLGKECIDPATGEKFVWITQSLEAKHYANTQASFTYTHDSWEEITRERDQRFPQYDIVGWYHTHPNFGIFLSHHDLFIHHNFFSQALQVAYVVDPINQTRGFFHWRDGGMAQVAGYYLTADRGDRIALARMANDLEQIPNTEGGSGGSFSPRLEAELIKMLTRPGQRTSLLRQRSCSSPHSTARSGFSWGSWAWRPFCGSPSSWARSRHWMNRIRSSPSSSRIRPPASAW